MKFMAECRDCKKIEQVADAKAQKEWAKPHLAKDHGVFCYAKEAA